MTWSAPAPAGSKDPLSQLTLPDKPGKCPACGKVVREGEAH